MNPNVLVYITNVEENRNFFKDHYSTTHPFFAPHSKVTKMEPTTSRPIELTMDSQWKNNFQHNSEAKLKTPQALRQEVLHDLDRQDK